MIKEIFDIEPIQKNSLIVFISILSISFLQIFLFKNEILEKSAFEIIGVCLGLTVCWYIASILPMVLFVKATEDEEDRQNGLQLDLVIIVCGLLALAWIILLTYIAYEFDLTFKMFIRGSIAVIILRSVFWFVYGLITNRKKT